MRTLKDGQLRVVFWNEVKPDEENGGAPVEKGDDLREQVSQLMWMIDLSRWLRIPRFVAFSQSPKRCRSPQATCIWYAFRSFLLFGLCFGLYSLLSLCSSCIPCRGFANHGCRGTCPQGANDEEEGQAFGTSSAAGAYHEHAFERRDRSVEKLFGTSKVKGVVDSVSNSICILLDLHLNTESSSAIRS